MFETLTKNELDALRIYIASINPLLNDGNNIKGFIKELLTIISDFKVHVKEYVLNRKEIEELKVKYFNDYTNQLQLGKSIYHKCVNERDAKLNELSFKNKDFINLVDNLLKPNDRLIESIKLQIINHYNNGELDPDINLILYKDLKINKEVFNKALMNLYINNLYKDELISSIEYIKLKEKIRKGS